MQVKPHKIVIIGGGHAAMTLLEKLADMDGTPLLRGMLPLEVEILEAKPTLDGGPAWSKESVLPCHLLNVYVPPRQVQLIKFKYLEAGLQYPDSGEEIRENELRRDVFGERIKITSRENLETLKNAGVRVHISCNTRADAVEKTENGYAITASNGKTFHADSLVLATGHWQGHSSMQENTGVFASPWPASALEKGVDLHQKTAIMGSSLSAVDTALTLAHAAGSFEPARDERGAIIPDRLVFKPKPGLESFGLKMFSPNGLLPDVKGHDGSKIAYAPKGVDPKTLESVFQGVKRDFLESYAAQSPLGSRAKKGLKDAFRFIRQSLRSETATHDAHLPRILEILKDESLSLDDSLKLLYTHYKQQDPTEQLTKNLDRAAASLKHKEPILEQEYLHSIVLELEKYYRGFSAEDQERFMHDLRPLFNKITYGMVYSNAKQIQALLAGGFLEVQAMGPHSSLGTREENNVKLRGGEVRYHTADGKEKHEYFPSVVKAYGDSPSQLRKSSVLMTGLFDKGLAREMLTPFADQTLGAHEFQQQQKEAGPGNIREISGAYYRSGGVLALNPENYELLPADVGKPNEETNIYGYGPLATAQRPLLQGVDALDACAVSILKSIHSRVEQSRKPRFFDPASATLPPLDDAAANELLASLVIFSRGGTHELAVMIDPGTTQQAQTRVRELVARNANRPIEDVGIVFSDSLNPELQALLDKRSRGKSQIGG